MCAEGWQKIIICVWFGTLAIALKENFCPEIII
jgi:hypothetical protein